MSPELQLGTALVSVDGSARAPSLFLNRPTTRRTMSGGEKAMAASSRIPIPVAGSGFGFGRFLAAGTGPALFALVGVAFFLRGATFSDCAGSTTVTGWELATHTTPRVSVFHCVLHKRLHGLVERLVGLPRDRDARRDDVRLRSRSRSAQIRTHQGRPGFVCRGGVSRNALRFDFHLRRLGSRGLPAQRRMARPFRVGCERSLVRLQVAKPLGHTGGISAAGTTHLGSSCAGRSL